MEKRIEGSLGDAGSADRLQYKPSIFNVDVEAPEPYAGLRIVYNTLSGAVAIASSETASLLRRPNPAPAPKGCNEEAFQKAMVENGFLVECSADEISDLRASHESMQHDTSTLAVCIMPSYACNLRCPYCYEKGRDACDSVMDEGTQDQIAAFIAKAYEEKPFDILEVQWFGGEPMVSPQVIERLSGILMGFCREHGIGYKAEIITNATLIGPEEARMLADAEVHGALVTVDGPREMHNSRRPAADGSDSYEAVLRGLSALAECGIEPVVIMNTDKVNGHAFEELASELEGRVGVSPKKAKLNDYRRAFGCEGFCKPEFDLYDHAEFSREEASRFRAQGRSSEEYRRLLAPIPLFCRGQMDNYIAIDANGDVYKCDGYVGRSGHVMAKLADLDGASLEGTAAEYPFDDGKCMACKLLPVCKGNCRWERESCADNPCHPLKYTLEDYLQGWVEALDREGRELILIG